MQCFCLDALSSTQHHATNPLAPQGLAWEHGTRRSPLATGCRCMPLHAAGCRWPPHPSPPSLLWHQPPSSPELRQRLAKYNPFIPNTLHPCSGKRRRRPKGPWPLCVTRLSLSTRRRRSWEPSRGSRWRSSERGLGDLAVRALGRRCELALAPTEALAHSGSFFPNDSPPQLLPCLLCCRLLWSLKEKLQHFGSSAAYCLKQAGEEAALQL